MPAFFYLLSLHHRTLQDVVLAQHPLQRPLPFRYVIAVVSGIADALAAAADVGVVHLDIKEDNVMVDDPEAMDFEAEQIAVDATVVDYRQCHRRFEEPPEAVVVDWGTAMQVDEQWVVAVTAVGGNLALPEGAQPWGNQHNAGPELHIEWKRANDELERARVAVSQAYRAKIAAEQRVYSLPWSVIERVTPIDMSAGSAGCCAGGDAADIVDKQGRYDAAVTARDSITAVLDYRKQPSFEVGTMGFWMATGHHPCGDDYPMRLPVPYDDAAYPATPSSYPAAYRQLMVECVAFDPRDRPDIAEVAARLRELRAAAWMSAADVLSQSRRLVRAGRKRGRGRDDSWLLTCCVLCRCVWQTYLERALLGPGGGAVELVCGAGRTCPLYASQRPFLLSLCVAQAELQAALRDRDAALAESRELLVSTARLPHFSSLHFRSGALILTPPPSACLCFLRRSVKLRLSTHKNAWCVTLCRCRCRCRCHCRSLVGTRVNGPAIDTHARQCWILPLALWPTC